MKTMTFGSQSRWIESYRKIAILTVIIFTIFSALGSGVPAFAADNYSVQGDNYIPVTQYQASPSSSPEASSSPESSPEASGSPASHKGPVVRRGYAADIHRTESILKLAKADSSPLSSGEAEPEEGSEPVLAMAATTTGGESETGEGVEEMATPTTTPDPDDDLTPYEAYHELQLQAIGAEKGFQDRRIAAIAEWVNTYESLNEETLQAAISALTFAIKTLRGKISASPSASPSPSSTSTAPLSSASPAPAPLANASPSASPSSNPSASPSSSPTSSYYVEKKRYDAFAIGKFEPQSFGVSNTELTINDLEEKVAKQQEILDAALAAGETSKANIASGFIAYIKSVISVLDDVKAQYDALNAAGDALETAWYNYEVKMWDIREAYKKKRQDLTNSFILNGVNGVALGGELYPMSSWGYSCDEDEEANPGCTKSWRLTTPIQKDEKGKPILDPATGEPKPVYVKLMTEEKMASLVPYQAGLQDLDAAEAKEKALAQAAYLAEVRIYFMALRDTKTPVEKMEDVTAAYIGYLTVIENERNVAGGVLKNQLCSPFTSEKGADCVTGSTLQSDYYDKAVEELRGLVTRVKGAALNQANKDALAPIYYGDKYARQAAVALREEQIAQARWDTHTDFQDFLNKTKVWTLELASWYAGHKTRAVDQAGVPITGADGRPVYNYSGMLAIDIAQICTEYGPNSQRTIDQKCVSERETYWRDWAAKRVANNDFGKQQFWAMRGGYDPDLLYGASWPDEPVSLSNYPIPPDAEYTYFTWHSTLVGARVIKDHPIVKQMIADFNFELNEKQANYDLWMKNKAEALALTYQDVARPNKEAITEKVNNKWVIVGWRPMGTAWQWYHNRIEGFDRAIADWKNGTVAKEYEAADEWRSKAMEAARIYRARSLEEAWEAYEAAIA
ncbi:MAG: hypothetical protein JW847_08765 [Candidatus Omnitrophica bacterium]|nr:hypothetical protein [Candidatus Omnitrophota bacterium]